jgi:hypothetical protein
MEISTTPLINVTGTVAATLMSWRRGRCTALRSIEYVAAVLSRSAAPPTMGIRNANCANFCR